MHNFLSKCILSKFSILSQHLNFIVLSRWVFLVHILESSDHMSRGGDPSSRLDEVSLAKVFNYSFLYRLHARGGTRSSRRWRLPASVGLRRAGHNAYAAVGGHRGRRTRARPAAAVPGLALARQHRQPSRLCRSVRENTETAALVALIST